MTTSNADAGFRKEAGAVAFVSLFPTAVTAGAFYAAGAWKQVEHPDLEMTTGLVAVAAYIVSFLLIAKMDNSLKIGR